MYRCVDVVVSVAIIGRSLGVLLGRAVLTMPMWAFACDRMTARHLVRMLRSIKASVDVLLVRLLILVVECI